MSMQVWGPWRIEVFGDPYLVWHDGADFTALLGRYRSDPDAVTSMLRLGLDAGDYLAAESVRALVLNGHHPTELEEPLRAAARTGVGTFLVNVAQALLALTTDQTWSEPVVVVLKGASFWGERLDAARALVDFAPTPELIGALAAAVRDSEYLVRYHASNILLRYAGETGEVSDRPDLFAQIGSRADRDSLRDASEHLAALATAHGVES